MLHIQIGQAYQQIGDRDGAAKAFDRGYKACDNDLDLRLRFLEVKIDDFKERETAGLTKAERIQKTTPDDKDQLTADLLAFAGR